MLKSINTTTTTTTTTSTTTTITGGPLPPLPPLLLHRELLWTDSLKAEHENIKYYYMGFYIHTCPKMRYKVRYT